MFCYDIARQNFSMTLWIFETRRLHSLQFRSFINIDAFRLEFNAFLIQTPWIINKWIRMEAERILSDSSQIRRNDIQIPTCATNTKVGGVNIWPQLEQNFAEIRLLAVISLIELI